MMQRKDDGDSINVQSSKQQEGITVQAGLEVFSSCDRGVAASVCRQDANVLPLVQ